MFPDKDQWPRFQERGLRKYPSRGDISCRSALGAVHAELHDMMVNQDYHHAMPAEVKRRLVCSIVDTLAPITQKHDIEGLVMGADPA